ncbi:MAG: hypothetical protein B6A08_08975 [Sorangiineae bacterium NIC37A_2]|nr:MAG: hypothetical protein B6A08_08975 [Sorangiineae bacterium NIC37A_2]
MCLESSSSGGDAAVESAPGPARVRESQVKRNFLSAGIGGLALFAALFASTSASGAEGAAQVTKKAAAGRVAKSPLRTPEEALTDELLAFEKARGLEGVVLLREMWAHWDEVDPAAVESALRLAGNNTARPALERVYANTLSAFARLRRGDVKRAREMFGEIGYMTDWLLLGPFDNEGKAGFDTAYGPEDELLLPIVPGRAYSGKERPIRYRTLPEVFWQGSVNLGSVLRPGNYGCSYLTTFVSVEKPPANAALFVGAGGAYRVYWNGESVLSDDSYRGFDFDRRSVGVKVKPGWNRLTVKLCANERAPRLSLRLGHTDGRVLPGVTVRADVALSAEEEAAKPAKASAPIRGVAPGPLDEVQRIKDDPKAKAADLENAAKYLLLSGGDDPTIHEARSLAERAAALEPTIVRLLLAATLSEDRNTARVHLEKAKAIGAAAGSREEVMLLLAEASFLRSGPNPREAFVLYDRVLALDPDNLQAISGRVDLLSHAGLYRTALETLEKALVRRPHASELKELVASSLGRLGRTEAARAIEESLAAGRFDDFGTLRARIDLALRRKDKSTVEHFLNRLEAVAPDDVIVHRIAAETHRQLGAHERSYAELERARELAPEDAAVLGQLADYKGRDKAQQEQLALLKEILRLRPQDAQTREYVEHMAPPPAPPDEKYAMPASEFLKYRFAKADGHSRRTLRDLTVSTVYPSGLSRQFRQVAFQPLTDAAAAFSRQYAFQYQADSQVVQLRGAWVYRADGTTDEAIESGEGAADDPSIAMYTSARTFYVQFPRLEPGDVVELRYQIEDVTLRNEFADYFGDIAYLQNDEPVANAEYVLVMPKSRQIYFDQRGLKLKQEVKETADSKVYRFFADNLKAMNPEPYMPPWAETLGFIHASTFENWDALGRFYWGLIRDQFDLDNETKKLAREITKDAKTTEEKVRAVYGWVVKNTRYVALEFGIYGFKPRRCVQTVARGWGDCKDKATVIVTLLRELGIDANFVVVRTRLRGDFPTKLASLAPFDHAIAYVPELDLYLDGTAEYTGMRELPAMDQGALALIMQNGKVRLVEIPRLKPEDNVTKRETRVNLQRNGRGEINVSYEVRGNRASSWRSRYEAKGTRVTRLSEDMAGEFPGIQLDSDSITTGDLSDIEAPPRVSFHAIVPNFAREEGSLLRVNVTVPSHLASTYASRSTRKHDVRITDFSNREESITVTIPEGMQVQSAPENVSKKTPFGSYEISYEKTGRTITVKSSLYLFVDRVTPEQYADFRAFCAAADRALDTPLLLEPMKETKQ